MEIFGKQPGRGNAPYCLCSSSGSWRTACFRLASTFTFSMTPHSRLSHLPGQSMPDIPEQGGLGLLHDQEGAFL
jgi:hypothetical protein